jgi:hypothetical protein
VLSKASPYIDITEFLISMGDNNLMDVVKFADDAMIETWCQVMSQVMKDHWADPNSNVRTASKEGMGQEQCMDWDGQIWTVNSIDGTQNGFRKVISDKILESLARGTKATLTS